MANSGSFAPMIINGITVQPAEMAMLLKFSISDGANKALIKAGTPKERAIKSEAFRLFGRIKVYSWTKERLLGFTEKPIFHRQIMNKPENWKPLRRPLTGKPVSIR